MQSGSTYNILTTVLSAIENKHLQGHKLQEPLSNLATSSCARLSFSAGVLNLLQLMRNTAGSACNG